MVRCISQLLTPFLQFATIHIASSHLSSPMGESSKIVPTFIENWALGWRVLYCQTRRAGMYAASVRPQVGQITPCLVRNQRDASHPNVTW